MWHLLQIKAFLLYYHTWTHFQLMVAAYSSHVHMEKSLITYLHGRVAVKKPLLRKGNREKKLRYAKWQCGIITILTENRTKSSETSKEELWDVLLEAWRTNPEDYWKKLPKSCFELFLRSILHAFVYWTLFFIFVSASKSKSRSEVLLLCILDPDASLENLVQQVYHVVSDAKLLCQLTLKLSHFWLSLSVLKD